MESVERMNNNEKDIAMAFLAFKNCDVEKIESLLDDNKCDVASICATDPRYNGYCMLHFACGYCTLEIIEMVLKHPTCKINVLNKPAAGREQMTALDFIQFNLNDSLKEEAISLFRKHGGETGVEVLAKTSKTMSGRKIVKAKKQKKLIEHEEGERSALVRQMKDCNVGSNE